MKKINTDVLIVGAGPVGLFSVFELGQLGIKACIVDCLDEVGGQCSALYPEKPIYDIPAYPVINAQELILNLNKQIKPFNPKILLSQKVEKIIDLDNSFKVFTTSNTEISTKCIFIAAGNGAFGPNKPPIKNIDKFENKSVFYSIKNKSIFNNKTIAIAGGGDSAVDWAIELSKNAKKVFFIHRRQNLRASPKNVDILKSLQKKNVEFIIPFQLDSINGKDGKISELILKDLDNNNKKINTDFFLPFFGLSNDLGPIKNWELEIEKNILKVDQSTCKTSKDRIYAIGDVCTYAGKLKLILTGFSEAATAAHDCYKTVHPEKVLHFEYSTTKGINQI
jgi:thioredoxin reductase (NADPH)